MQPYEQDSSPYSLGTTPIFNKLLEIFQQDAPKFDTVFLNLGTILRNCASNKNVTEAKREDKRLNRKSTKPAQILIQEAKDEILRFTGDVCKMMNDNTSILFPSVFVYFVNYRKCVPKSVYRVFTESEREIALAETMLRGIVHGAMKDGTYKRVNFVEYPMDSVQCPHRLMIKALNSIKSNHHVIMISHHRLDYHIHRHCSDFSLIDSYTGNIYTSKDLPKKVFNEEVIPFTTTTHAVLGDKCDIKCSLSTKEKNALIEVATKFRWMAHSDEFVRSEFRRLKIPIPFEI